MPIQNPHLQALYMSKAESRARWSYIGLLIPILGIIIGCMAQSTLKRIESTTDEEEKEKRRIGRIASGGIIISLILFLIGIFFIYVFFKTLGSLSHATGTTGATGTTTSQSSQDDAAGQLANATLYKIGDTVQFAHQNLKVNAVRTATSIKEDNAYSTATKAQEGTKFVVISMTVTNTTNKPFLFDGYDLIDENGRHYEMFNAIGDIDNYINVRDLAPSIPETGVAVYQVPNDATEFRLGGVHADTEKMLLVKFKP